MASLRVPGNAEYKTPNVAGYFQYFAGVLSPYGETATDPSKGDYSFNVGDWHVVALNSNCGLTGVNCKAQRAWLKSDSQADGHLCEVVLYHHAEQKSFATTAASSGVDLALAGHKHFYERWDRKFNLHSASWSSAPGASRSARLEPADAAVKAFGVAKLTLNASSYSWQFIDITGAIRDSGSDVCRS